MEEQDATCAVVSQQMQDKVDLLDFKIKKLQTTKEMMLRGLNNCDTCCMEVEGDSNCAVLTTDR